MTVSAATKFNSVSATGNSSFTSSSISTTSGNLIVVFAGLETNNGSTDPSGGITCTDNLTSPTTTYTPVGNIGNATAWSQGFRVFTAVSDGRARTITINNSGVTKYQLQLIVLELSSASGSVTGLVTNGNAGDAAITLTLAAAPASADMTIFARLVDGGTNDSPPTMTMAAGWSATVEANATDSDQGGVLAISTRTGSTSTSVSCTNATSSSSGSYQTGKCMALAINFTASSGTNVGRTANCTVTTTTTVAKSVGLQRSPTTVVLTTSVKKALAMIRAMSTTSTTSVPKNIGVKRAVIAVGTTTTASKSIGLKRLPTISTTTTTAKNVGLKRAPTTVAFTTTLKKSLGFYRAMTTTTTTTASDVKNYARSTATLTNLTESVTKALNIKRSSNTTNTVAAQRATSIKRQTTTSTTVTNQKNVGVRRSVIVNTTTIATRVKGYLRSANSAIASAVTLSKHVGILRGMTTTISVTRRISVSAIRACVISSITSAQKSIAFGRNIQTNLTTTVSEFHGGTNFQRSANIVVSLASSVSKSLGMRRSTSATASVSVTKSVAIRRNISSSLSVTRRLALGLKRGSVTNATASVISGKGYFRTASANVVQSAVSTSKTLGIKRLSQLSTSANVSKSIGIKRVTATSVLAIPRKAVSLTKNFLTSISTTSASSLGYPRTASAITTASVSVVKMIGIPRTTSTTITASGWKNVAIAKSFLTRIITTLTKHSTILLHPPTPKVRIVFVIKQDRVFVARRDVRIEPVTIDIFRLHDLIIDEETRTFRVTRNDRNDDGDPMTSPLATIEKNSIARLDYKFNWAKWLIGDSIATDSFAITGPDAALTIVDHSHDFNSATVWLEGGTAGSSYVVSCTITTNSSPSKQDVRTIIIDVV